MRYLLLTTVVAAVTIACNAHETPQAKLTSKKDSISYAIGINIGKNMKQQELDVDPAKIAAGLADGFGGTATLTDEQIQSIMMAFQMEMSQKQQAKQSQKATENLAKSEKWLNENKSKPGVMTTPSGLQYRVVKEGTGKKPTASSTVKVHYTGTTTDGTKFDSSIDRGEPAEFSLSGVIPGWTEGLQLMTVGSKYILYVPPQLAYGENGAGGAIGPNEALIFEVELLDIVNK